MDGELRGLRGNRKNRDTFQAGELYHHLVPCFFQKAPFFLGFFLIFQIFPATFDTRGYLSRYTSATLNGTMFDLGLASNHQLIG